MAGFLGMINMDLIFEMIEIPAIAFYIYIFLHGARYIEVWTLALTLFFY